MSTQPLLSFEPSELSFPSELNKQVESSIRFLNNTENHVAFKLLSTKPKNYGVRPRIGILPPGEACDITVTTHNVRCNDKFMIRSAVASADTTMEDVRKMFNKEAGDVFQESILRVVCTKPPESSFEPSAVESPKSNPFGLESPRSHLSRVESPESNVPEVTNPVIQPPENVAEMSPRKLLDVQPPELQFPLNPNEELSCSIQLSNVTENHVVFRVKTTSPKYFVQPNTGILLPQSKCDITVRTREQSNVPYAMQTGDKVLIQSILATTAAATEDIILDMFDKASSPIQERELQVVYTSKQENNSSRVFELIIISLLGLAFCYLMKQTLSLIWSLTMLAIMLVMKMIKKLVSESLEDLVVKALLYIVMYFVQFLFGRKENIRL